MIALGSDHGGFELKQKIITYLKAWDVSYKDFGTYNEESVDYAPIAVDVSLSITSGESALGILCCGTGIGISMAANKMKGIRAACCSDVFSAEMTRRHNDANILCLGGRVVREENIEEILRAFLQTPFEGGRHSRRVAQIMDIEKREC